MQTKTNRAVVLAKPLLLQPVFQEPNKLLSCCSPILCLIWSLAALQCAHKICLSDSLLCYGQPHLRTTNCMTNSSTHTYAYVELLPLISTCTLPVSFDCQHCYWANPSFFWVFTLNSTSPRPPWASKQWWAMLTIHGFSISKRWMMTLTPLILKS